MTTTYATGAMFLTMGIAALGIGAIGPVAAQQVTAPQTAKAAPKKDVGELQKLVDSGIASLEGGKVDLAVQQLTSALSAGGLPVPLLARALYHRGVAYRRQSKPAQAIADLTSALWLKGGLTDSERKEALAARSAAYVDAGLPDQSPRVAAAPEPKGGSASQAASPAPQAQADAAQSGGTGFFATLFGAAAPSGSPASVETASVAGSAAAAKAPAAGAWRAATEVKPVRQTTKVEAPPPAKGWSASTVTAQGEKVASASGFRIQIANLRTQTEAQSLADRLLAEHGRELAGRNPEIIETAMGGGRFWRIKIGPFDDTGASQAFCAKIRNKGHDCMIVRE